MTAAVFINGARPAAATPSAKRVEGCAVLPYKGPPLTRSQAGPWGLNWDARGGIVCGFTVNSKLPIFRFHFLGKPDNTLGDIEVTEGNSPKVIQTIRYPRPGWLNEFEGPSDPTEILVPVDANFDAYEDLETPIECGQGNCVNGFYLYDPKTNRFVYNAFLSQLSFPRFNAINKTVTSYWNSGAALWGHETYRYENGRYVPVGAVWHTCNPKTNVSTEKAYERRNGKLVAVATKKGTCP